MLRFSKKLQYYFEKKNYWEMQKLAIDCFV
jgi:hypothetical protein